MQTETQIADIDGVQNVDAGEKGDGEAYFRVLVDGKKETDVKEELATFGLDAHRTGGHSGGVTLIAE